MPSQLDDWLYHDSSEIDREFADVHEKHHQLFNSYMHGVLIIVLVIIVLVVVEWLKRCVKARNNERELKIFSKFLDEVLKFILVSSRSRTHHPSTQSIDTVESSIPIASAPAAPNERHSPPPSYFETVGIMNKVSE